MKKKYNLTVIVDEDWIKEDTGIKDTKEAILKVMEPLGHSGLFLEKPKDIKEENKEE